MSRNGPGKKFDGAPCKKCGSTLRYVSTSQCVRCCNSRDRTGTRKRTKEYQKQLRASHYRTGAEELTPSAILWALLKDAPAAVSRQSKMYLGIPKHQQEIAKPAPMTAGDVWRSMLPVGARMSAPASANVYSTGKPKRDADCRELLTAVAALVPSLPDIVTTADIIPRLDDALVAKLNNRMPLALGRALRACGTVRLKMSAARRVMYVIRQADAYRRMSWRATMEHHAKRTHTRPNDPQPVGERRQASRRRQARNMAAGAANAPTATAGP